MSDEYARWLDAMDAARKALDEPMERPDIERGLALVEWAREWRLGGSAGTRDALSGVPGSSGRASQPERSWPKANAQAALLEILGGGEQAEQDVWSMLAEKGISRATYRRAREDLGVLSRKEKGRKGGRWMLRLPASTDGSDGDAAGDPGSVRDAVLDAVRCVPMRSANEIVAHVKMKRADVLRAVRELLETDRGVCLRHGDDGVLRVFLSA